MSDEVVVALITALSAVVAALIHGQLRRSTRRADRQVMDRAARASTEAEESSWQVGGDMGNVVASAIGAAVRPVNGRLCTVETELRTLRGDLVPVAVADRGIIHDLIAEGVVSREQVVIIPESVAPLYPVRLRTVPHHKETEHD